jgi:hypothetical protein
MGAAAAVGLRLEDDEVERTPQGARRPLGGHRGAQVTLASPNRRGCRVARSLPGERAPARSAALTADRG